MPTNYLITGPPRSGKTTVIQNVIDRLEARGYRAGGIYCPEIRSDGDRVGFEIVDVMTGESGILAHVDQEDGPQVGKYRVNVATIGAVCATAFPRALDEADFLVIDEIAPMEVYCEEFREQVRRALDADLPLMAAIQYHETEGFIGEVKNRDDTEIFEVTEDTRNALPATLTEGCLRCCKLSHTHRFVVTRNRRRQLFPGDSPYSQEDCVQVTPHMEVSFDQGRIFIRRSCEAHCWWRTLLRFLDTGEQDHGAARTSHSLLMGTSSSWGQASTSLPTIYFGRACGRYDDV